MRDGHAVVQRAAFGVKTGSAKLALKLPKSCFKLNIIIFCYTIVHEEWPCNHAEGCMHAFGVKTGSAIYKSSQRII